MTEIEKKGTERLTKLYLYQAKRICSKMDKGLKAVIEINAIAKVNSEGKKGARKFYRTLLLDLLYEEHLAPYALWGLHIVNKH